VVKELVGAPIRFLMHYAGMRNLTVKQTDAVAKGIYGVQVCRTRYIDDTVQAALSQGIEQLVILGAGFDTRSYRLPGVEHVKVFEADLPAVQEDKVKKIQRYFGRSPEHVTFVPIDFDRQSVETIFAGTVFDSSRPAAFIWEGVTQYITEEAASLTLSFIGKSAPGSTMAFTYVLKSIIERCSDVPGADKLMDTAAKSAPWIFGLEPSSLQAYLQPFHLALVADVGHTDYKKTYLEPLGRNLAVFEGERIAVANVE